MYYQKYLQDMNITSFSRLLFVQCQMFSKLTINRFVFVFFKIHNISMCKFISVRVSKIIYPFEFNRCYSYFLSKNIVTCIFHSLLLFLKIYLSIWINFSVQRIFISLLTHTFLKSLLSRFCSLETVIKKVITLEGQFPNCFYGLCSLIFQSVCLNTGLCHGNFPIGFNIVALVPLLPDSVFYPVPDFLPRSTESSDPLLMFVIHRYFQDVQFRKSGSLQMNFFSLLVSYFLRWNHRRNDGSLFGK